MDIFTAGDRTPFTYVVTHKTTGMRYYGAKYSKECQPSDLWNTYFTSSQKIRDLIKQEGRDAFTARVRKTFPSVESCLEWELIVLTRLKVATNDRWYNKSAGGKRFYAMLSREQNPNFGKHWVTPEVTRQKIAASLTGITKSKVHCCKIAAAMTGSGNPRFGVQPSKETRVKLSNAGKLRTQSQETRGKIAVAQIGSKNHNYGKQLSPEARAYLSSLVSNTVWMNNGVSVKRIQIEQLPLYEQQGWVRGRIQSSSSSLS